MAIDRQSIEKSDFPIGRRGYDPDAVDSHLAAVAAEVEDLRRASRERTENLATLASQRVGAIIEAAEQSGADIGLQAETEARATRVAAEADARATREQANEQAREYVDKVAQASTGLLQRVDAMESDLGELVDTLRTGANRLNADLQLLQGNLAEMSDATGRRSEPGSGRIAFGAADSPAADTAVPPSSTPAPASDRTASADLPEPDAAGDDAAEAPGPGVPDEARGDRTQGADDPEGARLVALNMALNGSARGETDQYLAEHFSLADRAGLLDEVYATVEG